MAAVDDDGLAQDDDVDLHSRPSWTTFESCGKTFRVAILKLPEGSTSMWMLRDFMEFAEPNRKPHKVWKAGAQVWTAMCDLCGCRATALQAPYRQGDTRIGDPRYSCWFIDLAVSPGYILSYLLQKASQKVAAKYKAPCKTAAQTTCADLIDASLRDTTLQVTSTLRIEVDGMGMVNAQPLIWAVLAEDCRKRNVAARQGWAWLQKVWEELRRLETESRLRWPMDYCSIGAAMVFITDQFSFEHIFSEMNTFVSLVAMCEQAMQHHAQGRPSVNNLVNFTEFKTTAGKQQYGAMIHQDGSSRCALKMFSCMQAANLTCTIRHSKIHVNAFGLLLSKCQCQQAVAWHFHDPNSHTGIF